MCRGAGGGGAATQSALLEAQLDAGPGCQRRLALRVRRRGGVVAARPQAPAARLIAASRSGLGVRRSALSGVRSSACCTPALLPRSIGVERLQRLLMVLSSRRPIAQFRWKKRPRMKSKCSYACLPIRWHGSPRAVQLCVRWCTSSAWRTSASAAP